MNFFSEVSGKCGFKFQDNLQTKTLFYLNIYYLQYLFIVDKTATEINTIRGNLRTSIITRVSEIVLRESMFC